MNTAVPLNYYIEPGGELHGNLQVPGDKSISHRCIMLGAIANGVTYIDGFLQGEDTLATMAAFEAMGVVIDQHGASVIIKGVGLYGLHAPSGPLDLGNSGTSTRLLAGLLAAQKFDAEIRGDASLMKRPMQRITDPLKLMHANITCSTEGTLPIHIHGGQELQGIEYQTPVASAQLKSCLLLAGLYARGKTCIHETIATRDHTERMMQCFGATITKSNNIICITSGTELQATSITIPADISSAAFFIVGAAIAKGSDITIQNVGINPTRDAVLQILQAMGADITLKNQRVVSGEPVADIRVCHSQLKGIEIPIHLVPSAIDEFPVIMIAAACAEGMTVLHGAAELRIKESDRIQAIAQGLEILGIDVVTFEDGMQVSGGKIGGGTVDSQSDHRIAMAFAVAGLCATQPIKILDCANVATSFPNFVELANAAGLTIKSEYANDN